MQNHSTDGATMRARLNELPALIEAAVARGDKEAGQLRLEKTHLEEIAPILEAEAKKRACQESSSK